MMLCAYQKDHHGSNTEDAGESGSGDKKETVDGRHLGSSTAMQLDFKVLERGMETRQE